MSAYNEDNLVQKTTAEYLPFDLHWNESILSGLWRHREVHGCGQERAGLSFVSMRRNGLSRLNGGSKC